MTQRWSMLKGVVGGLIVLTAVACAVIAGPPRDLVAKNDHAGLEAWYAKEASHLRQRAHDMKVMAEEYQKNLAPSMLSVQSSKIDMVQHCQTLAAIYTKAADEAEVIARAHQDARGRL